MMKHFVYTSIVSRITPLPKREFSESHTIKQGLQLIYQILLENIFFHEPRTTGQDHLPTSTQDLPLAAKGPISTPRSCIDITGESLDST
jgi:hypothetical protein